VNRQTYKNNEPPTRVFAKLWLEAKTSTVLRCSTLSKADKVLGIGLQKY
jgi:hypothetical protein